MEHFIEEFINFLAVERGLADNTLVAYRRDLNKYSCCLSQMGIKDCGKVKRQDITQFIFHVFFSALRRPVHEARPHSGAVAENVTFVMPAAAQAFMTSITRWCVASSCAAIVTIASVRVASDAMR